MGLLDNLLNSANDKLQQKANSGEWFDDLTSKADGLLNNTADGELKNGGKIALDALKAHRQDVIDLGKNSLTLFVAHMASGQDEKAVLEYIKKASADDLIKGMLNDAKAVVDDKKAREKAKAEALALIKDITLTGARYLLPLILAAV